MAIVPLEGAAWLARGLHRSSGRDETALRPESAVPIGGSALAGFRTVLVSPYLRGIAAFLALMTFISTVLYFQQAELIGDAFVDDRAARTAFYAKIDLAVNLITVATQGLLTAHIVRRIGVGLSLAMIPVVACIGLLGLGAYPLLAVLVALQVIYRSGRYAIAKPVREVLFTVVGREDRYKAKSFIDAAVYRGGDLASGWIYAGLAAAGLSLGAIALVAAPVAAAWAAVGLALGRRQEDLARSTADGAPPDAPVRAGITT